MHPRISIVRFPHVVMFDWQYLHHIDLDYLDQHYPLKSRLNDDDDRIFIRWKSMRLPV